VVADPRTIVEPPLRAEMPSRRWPWALALGPVLPAIYWYFGRSDTIGALGHDGAWLRVTGPELNGLLSFLAAFVLLGIVPAALSRTLLGRGPRDLGAGLGNVREGLAWLAAGVPIGIAIGWSSATSPDLAAVYPLGSPELTLAAFLPHAVGYVLYYTGFEYHFRGFLLLGLERPLGPWAANVLQAGIVTLVHVGKPGVELAAAFPASLLFGWLVLRTRSIWYVVAIHAAVGLALDFFLLRG
jgi:membrane protease YdiL (CAAX protease family)